MFLFVLFFTTCAKICSGHNSPNSTDIFVVAEHADNAELIKNTTYGERHKVASAIPDSDGEDKIVEVFNGQYEPRSYQDGGYRTPPTPPPISTPVPIPADDDDVIFIKNEKEPERVGDDPNYFPREDIISLKDVFRAGAKSDVATEATRSDIMFVSGKNHENLDKNEIKDKPKPEKHLDTRRFNGNQKPEKKNKKKIEKLDCSNIDCNNTVNSVCGEKTENKQKKYRMFLNDCFFRKVNCDFKYEYNRYKVVPLHFCNHVAARSNRPPEPAEFRAFAPFSDPLSIYIDYYVTKQPSRRFMDGRQCSHPCPMMCPDDYAPECAVSIHGKKRVFANHCEMDYNSCIHGTVWQKRPLSVCAGTMKAELQENRRWINWMQRVGVVDKTGRIVLN